MSVHAETHRNPRMELLSKGELAENIDFPCQEWETDDRVLTIETDEVTVIDGELEGFARDVWRTVFGENHPSDSADEEN